MSTLVHLLRSLTQPLAALALVAAASLPAQVVAPNGPTLPAGCGDLRVSADHYVSLHVYAEGSQIWRWNAATSQWVFVAPAAVLFATEGLGMPIGVHYGGPTWTSVSGSSVVGALQLAIPVDPTAIPWLLLRGAASQGPGIFADTTFIQRVNTTGGRAPTRAGTPDEVVWVPYTAEYYFYRAR
jgi:hypothetical protein